MAEPTNTETKKAETPLHQRALDCFKQASDAESAQRLRELEDLKVYADDQWPDDVKANRLGGQSVSGMPNVPARPMLTINIVRQPCRQVLNQERNADMGVSVVPADDFSGLTGQASISDDEIELREGLIRRIQRQSNAQSARSWAFDRCVQAGRGFWRVLIDYVSDRSFDKDVTIKNIWNQASVYLDPTHEEPDGSDAKWALITSDLSWDDYKRQYPKGKAASAEEFRGLMDESKDWFSQEGGKESVRIAEYFYEEYTERALARVSWQGKEMAVWQDELPKDIPVMETRAVQVKTIYWAKINGVETIEGPTAWAGRYLPVIKVVGEELQPYDSDRRVQGVVRPSLDAQRGSNYMISAAVEAIALAPKAPFMATKEQVEGYEDMYGTANVRNYPVLFYNLHGQGGELLPPPQRQVVEPAIDAIMSAYQAFRVGVKDTTGIPDSSLGNVDPTIKSGRAILALQKQAEQGTSNFLDNMRRSIEYEGKIVNDLLKSVYDNRPGRLVQIVTGTDESKTVELAAEGQGAQPQKSYVLTDADFNVVVKVGRSQATRREEASTSMGEVLATVPGMFPMYADLYFKQQDWPGAEQMSERAKLLLPPQVQQAESKDGQPDPQQQLRQMQQQLQQLSQQHQMLTQELNAKNSIIETDKVKAQQQVAIEQVKSQAEHERLTLQLQSDEKLAKMKTIADLIKTQATLDAQQAEAAIEQQQAELDRRLGLVTADADRQHDAQMRAGDAAISMTDSDKTREFERERLETETDLAKDAQTAQTSRATPA